MTVNENSNKKIVFTSKMQVLQFLTANSDSVIFEGITMVEPNLDEFWECYAEKERAVDVPSFRKWFDRADLELQIDVELSWRYIETRSGLFSATLDSSDLFGWSQPTGGDFEKKPFDELFDLEDISMKMEDDFPDDEGDGDWELSPESCHFYLHKSSLEKHEEAA
jgi:hypothetical protein